VSTNFTIWAFQRGKNNKFSEWKNQSPRNFRIKPAGA